LSAWVNITRLEMRIFIDIPRSFRCITIMAKGIQIEVPAADAALQRLSLAVVLVGVAALAAAFVATRIAPQNVSVKSIASATIALFIVLSLLRWEMKFPLDPNISGKEIWLDYKLCGTNLLLANLLSSAAAVSSGAIVTALGGGFFFLRSDGWWFAGSAIVGVVFFDLYLYWMHRLQHTVPALWALHSFHHSAPALTFITGARHHWLDQTVNAAFFPFFAVVFRAPPEVLLAVYYISFIPNKLSHLNIRLPIGRFVMWVNNPQFHRIHHSSRPEHFNANFAPVLPLWDIMFGTAWRPGRDEFPATGLPDGERPLNVWQGIIWPSRALFRSSYVAAALSQIGLKHATKEEPTGRCSRDNRGADRLGRRDASGQQDGSGLHDRHTQCRAGCDAARAERDGT
jgi:sterol desaturase/sphingolipid hydroxylase (fatty acid hydroxylase superfamily)